MQALLRLDEPDATSAWLLRTDTPSVARSVPQAEEVATSLRKLGIAPLTTPPSLEELQERLASTMARASNLPHSAWRPHVQIVRGAAASDGAAPWALVAAEPSAAIVLQRAAELVLPFFPLVRG